MSLRILYHIVDQDAECYNNRSGTSQVPGCDYVQALPHRDIGEEDEDDCKKVAYGDNYGPPDAQQNLRVQRDQQINSSNERERRVITSSPTLKTTPDAAIPAIERTIVGLSGRRNRSYPK